MQNLAIISFYIITFKAPLMNIKVSLLLTTLATIGSIININAQSSVMQVVSVSAEIIEVITLSETTSLNFGTNIKTTAEGGTVVLDSNSAF